jgi:hypothetical protein
LIAAVALVELVPYRENPQLARDFNSSVGACIIRKNHVVDDVMRDFVKGTPQGLFSIESRKHHCDTQIV